MSRPGVVVRKTMIENHVWNTSSVIGSNLVEVHVGRLRAKLGDKEPGLIHTVRGFGYVLKSE
jgi:two-component system OmpR family response regulator